MNSTEVHCIREWAPMSDIMERIPSRVNRGLLPVDVRITCIDAVSEFLILGSSVGTVYWYNRNREEIQKLNLETATRVTCVKVVNSVEYMVAAGNASGQVSVFQIQKEMPADLNLVAPCAREKPIERYTIRDLHHDAITCCEWSKNGMKLYSGDRQGVVVLTELDYQNHLSKSAEILNEAYEIVQLSVHQRYLLVSTLYRSIICQRENTSFSSWEISQVGKKDRKQLLDCGGIFLKGETGKLPKLLCGRPGFRFWLSDIKGNVEKTLLFREAVARSATWEIPLLNPKLSHQAPAANDGEYSAANNFTRLYLYDSSDTLVVTHDDEAKLYVLNLTYLRVEAVATGFRKILDMCVCGNEFFILEGERSLLRLAPIPEKPNRKAKIIFNPSMPPPLPFLGITSSSFICESPAEYKLEEESAVINAEECFELPPIEEINFNIPIELAVESPRSEQSRRLEIFQQISDFDFDHSILHHSDISTSVRTKRSKVKSREHIKSEGIVEIGRSAIIEPAAQPQHLEITTNQATLMEDAFCTEPINTSHKTTFSDLLPDDLSPDTLKKTIDIKTKQLTEELDIPALHLEPITAEELSRSQVLAAAPNAENQHTKQHWQLPLIYPRQHSVQVEDAGVQTTPCKKMYFLTDGSDFGNEQPIDGICETLCSATLKEYKYDETSASVSKSKIAQHGVLKFVSSKPVEEINSFLLDFSRARDPMNISPPASRNSNASSEWEFLDN